MGIEEERRLFYVGMTRAMKKLWISFAAGRLQWGNVQFNPPSRFIDEIPMEFCRKSRESENEIVYQINRKSNSYGASHTKMA